jgi:hypothetical protein
MHKPLDLMLPEDWKQRTRVFVTRKTASPMMAPLVPKEVYDADRKCNGGPDTAGPLARAMRKFVLQH